PLLALLGSSIMIIQYIANTASKMQKTFGRYLTDEVVKNLIDDPSALLLGGERRKVTILVSDVRGFSAISEEYPPEQVVEILNLYLEAMTDVINNYQGNINDFMGDGILVMFGAPISRQDDSDRAIACALAMQLAMEKVNKKNQDMNLPILEMGIGINTGEVIAGNIGSQKRAEYTVIGSHVNLAARIESYSVGGQVLISENTYKDTNLNLRIDNQFKVKPKGIKEPVTLYDVVGISGKYNLFLPKIDENIELLSQELYVEFIVLHGKHADGKLLPGTLVGLSANGAKLLCQYDLEILTNIKLKLLTETALFTEEPDIYAKVVKECHLEANYFLIRFTGIPSKALQRLNKVRKGSV
ncbi:MAG: adenylate/guanylate cyclase domain-containing protein, partial [Sphaerospermopsis sp. SIO1G2]|nr:adenylate/guanylate cyclase domain-containing protein [Sphaerospermopsis sp. SIO1G2]